MRDRNVDVMTEQTASGPGYGARARAVGAQQGIEHGFVARPRRAFRFPLWRWSLREILHRGGSVTRDDERAYLDLQAARDRSEWGSE